MIVQADTAGVIAPPPLIFLGFLLAGLGLGALLGMPGTGLAPTYRLVVAIVSLAMGAGLILGATLRFRSAKTAARPWVPTTAIVTDGVYGFTRNPMYLAMALIFAAAAFAADSLIALVALIPALLVIEFGVIRREERYLEAKFGDEYRRYKAAVRRWI
jgi:protein-S-isoprenylcysteine O-methyltransferase Ste14